MTSSKSNINPEKSAKNRDERLKAALKANMAKRKAQAKARANTAVQGGEAKKEQ